MTVFIVEETNRYEVMGVLLEECDTDNWVQ